MNDDIFINEKDRSRQKRRKYKEKSKQKIKDKYKINGYNSTDRNIGIESDTPKRCSCWKCGNPRKYFGELSLQEQREFQEDLNFDYGEILCELYKK